MINRLEQPSIKQIESVDFIAPTEYSISETVKLFHMKNVQDETSRFDLYFDAGKIRGNNGIAGIVNGLLLSGTDTKTSVQINNDINSLGGFYEAGASIENAVVTIHCLRENITSIFNTVLDAIQNLSFDEPEVKEYLADSKQRLKMNSEKVSYLSQRAFQKVLFASDDRYSSSLSLEDFDKLNTTEFKAFHKDHYLNGLTKVVLIGNIEDKAVENIIQSTKSFTLKQPPTYAESIHNERNETVVEKKGAIQSAIRVGRTLFNKNHEDYSDFLVLNTILGDYFGSRLMSNIREDKGYTYGIGTMLAELENTGYFLVATEVGHEVKKETLKEIKFEFIRLQNELVLEDELSLVKNYMLGQLLKSADGPYAMMDLFLSTQMFGKELDFYNKTINNIQNITPERIQSLAKKYLNWEDMSIVIAG